MAADGSIYASDLAFVHDAGFGGFSRDAAPGLLRRLRRAGIRSGLVVDLGCGSGIWAAALAAEGYDVLGVDLSSAALELAARRAPAARLVRASLHELELPPCAAVTALGEVLGYAADPRAGRDSAAGLFGRVHDALAPGGLLLFDVATPGRERREPRRSWHAGEGWALLLEARETAAGELVRELTVFRAAGGGWRRSDETHVLRLLRADELLDDLRAAGFEARTLRSYGRELRLPRGLVAVEARKAGGERRRARRAVA